MIYVDTNILIRLATNDIPTLREHAEQIVTAHAPRELFIPDAVVSELFFVLHHNPLYRYDRSTICQMLDDLLSHPQFYITGPAGAAAAIAKRHPKLDFTDCLLAAYADRSIKQLITFDKDLLKILD